MLMDPVRDTFRAIAATVVPESQRLPDAEWTVLEQIVERALSERPPRMQRQVLLFVRLLEWLPATRYGRRFTALDPARRTAFLAALADSPLLLVRRGVWGIRTLVFMGYYARPAAGAEIGYRASPRGWLARELPPRPGTPAANPGARSVSE